MAWDDGLTEFLFLRVVCSLCMLFFAAIPLPLREDKTLSEESIFAWSRLSSRKRLPFAFCRY